MNSTWGTKLRYSLFGESHGRGVGISIHGLPSGLKINMRKIERNLRRRKTGGALSSQRKESDSIEILSGEKDGYSTGSPLTFFLKNEDVKSEDYAKLAGKPRPSHADYAHFARYGAYADLNGSGHLSARLTAPIVIAGTLVSELNELKDILISSELSRIGNVGYERDYDFSLLERLDLEGSEKLKDQEIPIFDKALRREAERALKRAVEEGDSLGARLSFSIKGIRAGLGEPFFYSLESVLSGLFFSIPAVKAVEFGLGSGFAFHKGSEVNDAFAYQNTEIITTSNRSGGINGGMTNGMPVNFSLSFRPAPSIKLPQRTIDLNEKKECEIQIKGRHDACVALRALPIAEAMSYMALYELSS